MSEELAVRDGQGYVKQNARDSALEKLEELRTQQMTAAAQERILALKYKFLDNLPLLCKRYLGLDRAQFTKTFSTEEQVVLEEEVARRARNNYRAFVGFHVTTTGIAPIVAGIVSFVLGGHYLATLFFTFLFGCITSTCFGILNNILDETRIRSACVYHRARKELIARGVSIAGLLKEK